MKQNQHQAIIKWAKRGVKKKKGQLQINQLLTHHHSQKPLGVRMGSGRGKINYRYTQLLINQPVITYYNCNKQPASQVRKFFKKSQFKLFFFSTKL